MHINVFFDKIDTHINSAFPLKSVQSSPRNTPINPWFTPGLLVSRKTKQKLASLKIRKPTPENINKYKTYSNTYNYLLRKAKHCHYNDKFEEYSGNLRKTWETIRELIGKNKNKIYIPDFFRNGDVTISGDKNIADGFNDFFSSIGPELA